MIRPVQDTDMCAIAAIYNHYIATTTITFETEPLSVSEMAIRIKQITADNTCYVYESEGRVFGYCYAHKWKEKAAYSKTLETTVYVAVGNEHKGIGTKLMKRLIIECRKKDFHALIACITEGNETSNIMHKRLGFKQVSEFKQVGYKFDKWLNVADYELILD